MGLPDNQLTPLVKLLVYQLADKGVNFCHGGLAIDMHLMVALAVLMDPAVRGIASNHLAHLNRLPTGAAETSIARRETVGDGCIATFTMDPAMCAGMACDVHAGLDRATADWACARVARTNNGWFYNNDCYIDRRRWCRGGNLLLLRPVCFPATIRRNRFHRFIPLRFNSPEEQAGFVGVEQVAGCVAPVSGSCECLPAPSPAGYPPDPSKENSPDYALPRQETLAAPLGHNTHRAARADSLCKA